MSGGAKGARGQGQGHCSLRPSSNGGDPPKDTEKENSGNVLSRKPRGKPVTALRRVGVTGRAAAWARAFRASATLGACSAPRENGDYQFPTWKTQESRPKVTLSRYG